MTGRAGVEWLFLFAILLVFVGVFFWVRERRAAHRDAEKAREEAFLIQMASASRGAPRPDDPPAPHNASPPANAPIAPAAERQMAAPARAAGSSDAAKPPAGPPYLDHRHRVVYFWLKTGLPKHEIIPRGSLRRVVGREQADKDMLLDFVICDASLAVMAVVDLDRGPDSAAAVRFKKALLETAGVRYACWPAEALPDKSTLPVWLS